MISDRKCLECGDLLHGRADKKFCGDQCRNAYNNKQLGETNNTIRRVNRILKKNQSLLAQMNFTGKTTISRNELVKNEFHFGYFTSQHTTRRGRVYYFCYDQGYSLTVGDKVLLMQKKETIH
jgi:hypothetical protein